MSGKVIIIIVVCGLFLASCRDFNPVTDSSVRTVRFLVDPRDALDSMIVEDGDTVMMFDAESLPEGYRLRTELMCYDENGRLVQRSSYLHDTVMPFVAELKRVDTTMRYRVLFVSDIVEVVDEGIYYYTWPMLDVSGISTLHSLFVWSHNERECWLNSFAYNEWEGEVHTNVQEVRLRRGTYCSVMRLINCDQFDSIRVHVSHVTQMGFFPFCEQRRYWVPICEFAPDGGSRQFPILCPSLMNKVYMRVIKTKDNVSDSLEFSLRNECRPFSVWCDVLNEEEGGDYL